MARKKSIGITKKMEEKCWPSCTTVETTYPHHVTLFFWKRFVLVHLFLSGVSNRRIYLNFARYAYSWKTRYKKKEELLTRVTDVNIKQPMQQNGHNQPFLYIRFYFLRLLLTHWDCKKIATRNLHNDWYCRQIFKMRMQFKQYKGDKCKSWRIHAKEKRSLFLRKKDKFTGVCLNLQKRWEFTDKIQSLRS